MTASLQGARADEIRQFVVHHPAPLHICPLGFAACVEHLLISGGQVPDHGARGRFQDFMRHQLPNVGVPNAVGPLHSEKPPPGGACSSSLHEPSTGRYTPTILSLSRARMSLRRWARSRFSRHPLSTDPWMTHSSMVFVSRDTRRGSDWSVVADISSSPANCLFWPISRRVWPSALWT